jgi:hypothetical protein
MAKWVTYNKLICDLPLPRYMVPVVDKETGKVSQMSVSEKMLRQMQGLPEKEEHLEPEQPPKPFNKIEEAIMKMGFASEAEFHQMVSEVDLTKPGMMEEFRCWQSAPNKSGLQVVLNWQRSKWPSPPSDSSGPESGSLAPEANTA